ncbi:MAG: sigma-70 family RNA polymerase sigma factor [Planctomycetota bacterium]|jgi:RNA polymerase sigma-70 factor (ECF subfamily)
MSDPARDIDPESLLEHRAFVRAVVRKRIPDEHHVEDIVQETCLTALRSPPRAPGALHAWLARVGRNLAVSSLRRRASRARRERHAARPERLPSAREAAEKLEHHRMVVEAVLALDEPLRSTVLLRFYEDLPPRRIAEIQAIPVATVRSRLRRAVTRMRLSFDEAYGGDRRAWCLALLPLLLAPGQVAAASGAGGTTVLSLGGSAMKAKLTFAALALGVLGTTLVVWRATDRSEHPPARSDTAQRDTTVPLPEMDPDARRAREEAEALRAVYPDGRDGTDGGGSGAARSGREGKDRDAGSRDGAKADADRARPPPPGPGLVTGTVKLADDRLPLGVEVTLTDLTLVYDGRRRDDGDPCVLETEADGAFRFDALPPGRYGLRLKHPEFAPHEFSFDVTEAEGAGPYDVVLKPGGQLKVRVLGVSKAPLVDQLVSVSRERSRVSTAARTDADGLIVFENLAPGYYHVRRPVPGTEGGQSAMRTTRIEAGETAEVVFEVSCGLFGTVLGADGRPLPQAFVRLVPTQFGKEGYRNIQTRTDDEGAFDVQGFPPGEYSVSVQVIGERSFATEVAKLTFKGGDRLAQVLQVKPTLITGHIARADTGEALAGMQVSVWADRVEVEDGAYKRRGVGSYASPNNEGRYEFPGLAPGHYRIRVHARDKSLRPVKRIVDFTAGGTLSDVDFALETRTIGTLRLEVLGPDGKPATGLSFSLILERKEEGERVSTTSLSLYPKEAGDGIYELELETGEREVSIWAGSGYHGERLAVSIANGGTTKHTVRLRQIEKEEEK